MSSVWGSDILAANKQTDSEKVLAKARDAFDINVKRFQWYKERMERISLLKDAIMKNQG